MILICDICGEEFDDKWNKFYKNEEGYREKLLVHYRRHEDDRIIKQNYGKKLGKKK